MFVTHLKLLRTARDLTQHRLAVAASIHQPILSAIERGRIRPTAAELQRLADVLGVPADTLLERVVVLR